MHRGELLAELCATKRLIAVAGAHGKTTTSGMLAHALTAAGADPAFLLGGELPAAGPEGEPANARWGAGEWIVAEADESDGSFLELRPEVAVVTNVELDHHSHWRGEGELIEAFARFAAPAAALVRPPGTRLAGARRRGLGAQLRGRREPPGRRRPPACSPPTSSRARAAPSSPWPRSRSASCASASAFPAATTSPTPPPRSGRSSAPAGSTPGCPRSRRWSRRSRRSRAWRGGWSARAARAAARSSSTTTPTTRPRSPPRSSALRELPHRRLIAVFQPHLYSRTKALAARFGRALAGGRRDRRARRLPGARAAGRTARGRQRPAGRRGRRRRRPRAPGQLVRRHGPGGGPARRGARRGRRPRHARRRRRLPARRAPGRRGDGEGTP